MSKKQSKEYLLITLDYPPRLGGVAYYYQMMTHALGDNIHVLADIQPGQPRDKKDDMGITYEPLLSQWIWPRWITSLFAIHKAAKQYGTKKIIVGNVLPLGTAALLYKRLFGIPYIVCTHGMDVTFPQKNPRKKALLKYMFEKSELIFSASEYTKSRITELGIDENKITVLNPSIEMTDTTSNINIREKFNISEANIILTTTRLVKRKGIDFVIEALDASKYKNDICYVIAGDGPEKERLQNLAAQKSYKIIFTRSIDHETKQALYEQSDIFVMTPYDNNGDIEGFGIVYKEAQAAGLPVIGSRSGGVPEAIENNKNGILVDEKDIHAITQTIDTLLSDSELRKKLGEYGKSKVQQELMSGNFKKTLLDALRDIK